MALTDRERIIKDVVIAAIIEELKQKLIVMPKYEEKVFPLYRLVPKDVEYEVPKPKAVEKLYDVPVPVLKPVPKEVEYEVPKIVEKVKEVPVPQLKYYTLETFKLDDVQKMRQLVSMLPTVLGALEKIVKFIPKEVLYEVKVPDIVKVPYPVDVPDYKPTTVLRPHFQDVKVLHPIIVEQIMTLDEWRRLSAKEREKVGEIVKSQLKVKGKK